MSDPLVTQGLSVTGFIVVIKAIITYIRVMGWLDLDEDEEAATITFIDTVIPIVAIWGGVWWAKRHTTSLSNPKDINGMSLTGPNSEPTKAQLQIIQTEAIELDKAIDDRRIHK